MKGPWAKSNNNVTNFSWQLSRVDEPCVLELVELCVQGQNRRPLLQLDHDQRWKGSI